jgi:glycosyltransferase involved in cell wall biosynthesis
VKRLKIGIAANDFFRWSGGTDFLWTVTDSLLATPRAETAEFYLLVPDSGVRLAWQRAREILTGKIQATPGSRELCNNFLEFGNRIAIYHIDIGWRAVRRVADKLDLNALLPLTYSLGRNFPHSWLAYAYDFQHKYFPANFTTEILRERDKHFDELLTEARAVIVNSQATARDIARFVPQATARVFTLPFAPAPRPGWFEDRPEILARYNVATPYFIISNQFWAHKDHATAFQAFRLIAKSNPSVSLVCTGLTAGATNPDYTRGLFESLERAGLKDRVQILGLIPKRNQIELLKNSCALIQPTLFEGGPGGGAVYDAVSLGVPAIVSDIPVNRELPDDDRIVFFPAGEAAALAARMEQQLIATRKKIDPDALRAAGQRRRASCGEILWAAIDFLL